MKKIFVSAIAFLLIFSLSACTKTPKTVNESESATPGKEINNSQSESGTVNAKTGEEFSIKNIVNITVNGYEWCEEIHPSSSVMTYYYLDDKENEKFFTIHGTLENLKDVELDPHYITDAQLTINDEYVYTAKLRVEEPDGTSFYANAIPHETQNLLIHASVPDEVYDIFKTAKLTVDFITDESKFEEKFDPVNEHKTFEITFTK